MNAYAYCAATLIGSPTAMTMAFEILRSRGRRPDAPA